MVALTSAICFLLGRGSWSGLLSKLGAGLFFVWAVGMWSFKLKDGMHWDLDLPLALCDLVFIIAFVCFLSPKPLLLTYLTYWGLGGTLQALITPDVLTEFPSREFIVFFIGHSVIVLAVFFLLGKNPSPELAGWTGVKNSFVGLLGYTVIVGLVDAIFGLNYGYLMKKPDGASVLDYLGPWPLYVLGGLAIAFVIFVFLSVGLRPLVDRSNLPREGQS